MVATVPDPRSTVRSSLLAAVVLGSLVLTSAATAAPPVRDRFPVEGEFALDGLSAACGVPADVAITGTFSITVFRDRNGVTVREVDTQPGTKLTYVSEFGEISVPFSGVLHTTYPEGAVVGAPATLVMTGNTGPFSDLVPMGSGRVVLDGVVVETDGPFAFTRFTQLLSASGNFSTQIDRVCGALSG
jgi:hypothetical protein